jgi:hypothetical protein
MAAHGRESGLIKPILSKESVMNKKTLRSLVIAGLIGIYALLGSACTKQDGTDAINKALLSQSQIEQTITNQFCDADNVLSSCP